MRAAALILALATSASAFMAPLQRVAPRVAPVNMDASSLVTAYRELYEVGGVQVTADVQQFGPIAGLVVFIVAANTLYMTMGGSDDEIAEEPIAEYQFGSAVLAGAKAPALRRRTPSGGRSATPRASRRTTTSACACRLAFTKTFKTYYILGWKALSGRRGRSVLPFRGRGPRAQKYLLRCIGCAP